LAIWPSTALLASSSLRRCVIIVVHARSCNCPATSDQRTSALSLRCANAPESLCLRVLAPESASSLRASATPHRACRPKTMSTPRPPCLSRSSPSRDAPLRR
jgi:hypothetical protein